MINRRKRGERRKGGTKEELGEIEESRTVREDVRKEWNLPIQMTFLVFGEGSYLGE